MSQELARTLRRLHLDRTAETLRRGWPEMPSWVFVSADGRPLVARTVDRILQRVLRAAGLPAHFTPHCLRHTYASLLLVDGVSPVYVQRQLGHTSIAMTCDLYGRWLPLENKAAVDGLDAPSGSQLVASAASASEVVDFPRPAAAGRPRTRWPSSRAAEGAAPSTARSRPSRSGRAPPGRPDRRTGAASAQGAEPAGVDQVLRLPPVQVVLGHARLGKVLPAVVLAGGEGAEQRVAPDLLVAARELIS
jgi:Phage integrase family